MKKLIICILLILLCSSSIAFGYVMGSTNLDFVGYPEFANKHFRPTKPYSRNSYSMQRYSDDVRYYVDDAKIYIEAANNDIQHIHEAIKNAKTEANAIIQEHNSFLKNGY